MHIFYNPGFELFPVLSMAKISVEIEEVDEFRVKQIVRGGSMVFTDSEKAFNRILKTLDVGLVRSNKSKGHLIPYQPSIVVRCADRVLTESSVFKWFVVKSN